MRLAIIIVLLCLVKIPTANACELYVKHQFIESSKDRLVLSLLKLSLSKTSQDICYSGLNDDVSSARESSLVSQNEMDVYWAGASPSQHQQNTPIRQAIFKGILGHRLFVIRQGEQYKFDKVDSLHQLKKLVAGQGSFWGDTKVLKAAGLPVITSTRGRRLWDMLAQGRFDYLPLAVHEPWNDIEIRPNHKLMVEENLMLVYPMALYFYVNTENNKLYELISKGMNKANSDGSYDEVLLKSQIMQKTARYANIDKRKVIFIDGPNNMQEQDLASLKKQTKKFIELIGRIEVKQ